MVSSELDLEMVPAARLDVINVSDRIREHFGDCLARYPKVLYFSYHTTAGYFEQELCARLRYQPDSLLAVARSFLKLFPPAANYHHDQLHLRSELTDRQRREEPRNADSHLAFMSSGLANCVTYVNAPQSPVYFVDLDGVHEHGRRRRRTTVVGFTRETLVHSSLFAVPMSPHPVDSVNLKDPRFGLLERIRDLVEKHGTAKGRIDVSLASGEHGAGLTVNEYETLLMSHDLADVLRNPLRFAAERGIHMLQNPRAIPRKARNYAKYDLVQVVNECLKTLGLSESFFERIVDWLLALPAAHFLGMKRRLSLLLSDREHGGTGSIVQGTYQSPILVQWKQAAGQTRRLNIRLYRFE